MIDEEPPGDTRQRVLARLLGADGMKQREEREGGQRRAVIGEKEAKRHGRRSVAARERLEGAPQPFLRAS